MQRRRTTRSSRIPGGRRGRHGRSHAPFGLPAVAPGTARGRAGVRPRRGQPPSGAGVRVLRPQGPPHARGAVHRRRAGCGGGRGGRSGRRRRVPVSGARRGRRPAERHRAGRESLPRRSFRGNGRRRNHRDQREDHGRPLHRPGVRHHRARGDLRGHGNARSRASGGSRDRAAYHSRRPRRAPEPGRDAARGGAPGGDGGVVARARTAPNRRSPVQGRLPHQRRTRPPRLPRERRGVRGGEAAAVHVAGAGGGGHQRGRPARPGHSRVGGRSVASSRLRARRPGRRGARPDRAGPPRPDPPRSRARTPPGGRRQPARGPVQRLQPARLCRGSPRDGHPPRSGRGRTRVGWPSPRTAATGAPRLAGPVGARYLRRLRPHARRAGRGAVRPSTLRERGNPGRVRMRRRARPGQAPAHGGGRGAGSGSAVRDQRQPPRRGPARHHRRHSRRDGGARVEVEPDRRRAIHAAVSDAEPDDIVLVAGKGHETWQEIGGERRPFDDVAVAREALARRAGRIAG